MCILSESSKKGNFSTRVSKLYELVNIPLRLRAKDLVIKSEMMLPFGIDFLNSAWTTLLWHSKETESSPGGTVGTAGELVIPGNFPA